MSDSDTVDILLFDNGNLGAPDTDGNTRQVVDAELQRKIQLHEINEPFPYSRLVHYRIHEKDMTVEQI
ncbi:MAG: aryl-sulfate sulfotransferase [Pseudomonadota bacterium]